jgi:precorrin-6B methylase 2
MQPLTASLLRRAGVRAGNRCLDVGCGGGHVSRELARIVGPAGRVVGIDLDAEAIALARADAEADGLQNLVFRVGDAARPDRGPTTWHTRAFCSRTSLTLEAWWPRWCPRSRPVAP